MINGRHQDTESNARLVMMIMMSFCCCFFHQEGQEAMLQDRSSKNTTCRLLWRRGTWAIVFP